MRVALLNFTSGIRLTKSINSSRGEWAQQHHVLPSTYKTGDVEFAVTKQQPSCLGWSHFFHYLMGKDSNTLLQDAANATLRSETLRRNYVRCNNRKWWCKK